MAENKKSFLLYCDLIHTINKLPNEKAGELFKHILEYVNDNDPTTDDLLISISFEPIKQQLKRDLKKFEGIVERNKLNGSKGGRPKKPKKPTGLSGNPSKPKKADSDNDNDNDINNIPEISIFMIYIKDYLENDKPRYEKIRTRMIDTYNAWKLNDWKDGNDKKIKNWKTKAIMQLRYIK